MTYLAPRQGLFAIIILVSFLIHTTLSLISTDQQLDDLSRQTGERMLTQLTEEVRLPLLSDDKVSLSVLTGRYTSESNIASIRIIDAQDNVLLQTGDAQLMDGETISEPVIVDNENIGEVILTLRDTSYGQIIGAQWLFILGSLIAHVLVWLVYGYIARPTRSQLAALSREAQDHVTSRHNKIKATHKKDGRSQLNHTTVSYEDEHNNNAGDEADEYTRERFASIHQEDDNQQDIYQQDSQQHKNLAHSNASRSNKPKPAQFTTEMLRDLQQSTNETTHTESVEIAPNPGATQHKLSKSKQPQTTQTSVVKGSSPERHALLADRDMRTVLVRIEFYDPHGLFSTVASSQTEPYFTLCTELLNRTVDELLQQPILNGVKLDNEPKFNHDGALVAFKSTSKHHKVALAGAMLAWLYNMMHGISSFKLNEMNRFHAPIHTGVSDEMALEHLLPIMTNYAKQEQILTLLPTAGLKQLSGHMQLKDLRNPQGVYERDCAVIEGVSSGMMERLVDVRDTVLLSSQ